MEKNGKYFWSPSVRWKKTDNEIRIEIFSYSGFVSDLFPDFYFLTQNGIMIEELISKYSYVGKNKFTLFLKDLIKKKILVKGVLTPQEIFYPQSYLFNKDGAKKGRPEPYNSVEKQPGGERGFENEKKIILKHNHEFPDIISQRRTCRTFDQNRVVDENAFSNLLAVFSQVKNGENIRYYYASSGSSYPIDVYVYVKKDRVENVAGGLYDYKPADNSLNLVNDTFEIPKNAHYFTNQNIYLGSAFSIFFIFNAEATMPKYGGIGYFYGLIETGIMVSTMTCIAEANGIGICSIGDMNFKKIEKYFNLNEKQVHIHTVEAGLKEKENK